MIECIGPDGGRSFQLVPRSREIEPRMGQHVSDVAHEGGGIDWSLGRKRRLRLSGGAARRVLFPDSVRCTDVICIIFAAVDMVYNTRVSHPTSSILSHAIDLHNRSARCREDDCGPRA
ncbi:MAG: DUF3363 domain-containing protein [Rhodobacteraceae bacterium]|nr:MAG: DUF3363 domain-containing protein [Paracoccaceae bacterium]